MLSHLFSSRSNDVGTSGSARDEDGGFDAADTWEDMVRRANSLAAPKSHECGVCRAIFYSDDEFIVHNRTHCGEWPFTCDACHKAFKYQASLALHARFTCRGWNNSTTTPQGRAHNPDRPYVCEICLKAFTASNSLVIHKRSHTGERPFACELCDKAFRDKSNLLVHKRTHSGIKPYACGMCGRAFSLNSSLKAHKRRHKHDDSGVASYCSDPGQTGSSNRPWLSRQTSPISSGVTRNSGGSCTNIQVEPSLPS